MNAFLAEYLPILIFLGIAVGLVCAMLGGSYLLARQNPDSEKLSAFDAQQGKDAPTGEQDLPAAEVTSIRSRRRRRNR